MAKRRDNGQGTATKLPNGSYMGRIFLGYKEDGKPNRKSVYGKTKSEVNQKMQELALNKSLGLKESSNMQLRKWILYWLENLKRLKLKPKTYEVYETQIRCHIIPFLGEIPLNKLEFVQVQNYITAKSKTLSSATVRKQYNILNSALERAVACEKITKNPCKYVELPVLQHKEVKALTLEQENKFLEASKADRLHTLFVVAFDTGLRLGELLALTWDDIDLEIGIITVNKNIVFVKDYEGKSDNINILKVQDSPKTKSSIRKVELTKRSLKLLYELRETTNSSIVFNTRTGNYLNSRNVERSFVRIATKIGLQGFNFHSSRHTNATRLFNCNVPINVVSKHLGHSRISTTTDTYISTMPSQRSDAIKALDLLHSGQIENKPITNQLR